MEGRPDWDAFIGGQYPARHRNNPHVGVRSHDDGRTDAIGEEARGRVASPAGVVDDPNRS
jgi:hypothetical protein